MAPEQYKTLSSLPCIFVQRLKLVKSIYLTFVLIFFISFLDAILDLKMIAVLWQ